MIMGMLARVLNCTHTVGELQWSVQSFFYGVARRGIVKIFGWQTRKAVASYAACSFVDLHLG